MKYNYIQRILSYYYRRLGRTIAKNPTYSLIIPVVIAVILSMGMFTVKIERNGDFLYAVINGNSEKTKRAIEELFPMNLSSNFDPLRLTDRKHLIYIMVFANDGGDMLRTQYLKEIASVDGYIQKLQVNWNNNSFNYSRICAKNNGECYKNSILLYNPENERAITGNNIKYPISVDPLTYVFVPYVVNLGGVATDDEGNVKLAKALRLVYVLDHDMNGLQPVVAKWQDAFLRNIYNWKSDFVTVQTYAPTALEEEFRQFTSELVPFIGLSALIIMIFSMVTCNTTNWVRSKPWLGMSACFSAVFALGSSFGVAMLCSVAYVDINIALPFLILGMGVDDAYVLISAWRRTKSEWSVEKRMEETYSEAAVSISITSLTNFLSFCVGMLTPYPIMQFFCIYAAISVLFTFLYLMSFFGACMALSGYRERNGIHPFTCRPLAKKRTNPEENNDDDCIMAFFRDKLGTLLTFFSFKIVVITIYFANLITGIWSLQFVVGSMEMADILSSDSHLAKSAESHYKYFTQYPYTLHVVINETLNYADPQVQKKLDELFHRLESNPHVGDERTRLSWLKYYLSFQKNPFGKFLLRGYNTTDKQEFIDALRHVFLNIRLAEQFKKDIVFNENHTEIISSRFVLLAKNVSSVEAEQTMHRFLLQFADTNSFSILIHSMLFGVFEQTSAILAVVTQLGWVTTLLISVLFFLFIPSVKCALCVSLAVVSSLLETVGYMALWGVKLDIMSMIILTLSVGFSINYPTHMSFSFMMDKLPNSNDRLKRCLYAVATPVMQGTFSTILAALPLLYKRAYLLDSAFKIIFLITASTAFHALFVIPVVLSILETVPSRKPPFRGGPREDISLEEKEECLEKPQSKSCEQGLGENETNADVVRFFQK